ncbi:hypothetical protein [Paraburkholderia flagellata]|nr:hypothetical protein [Paraburkholderia flagellata]
MKKLFSAGPTRIGRPDGPAAADAIPEALHDESFLFSLEANTRNPGV